jgi:hypothetical protein
MAQEAVKHHKPDPGMAAGMGKQGRIGTTTKTLLTQHLIKMKVHTPCSWDLRLVPGC